MSNELIRLVLKSDLASATEVTIMLILADAADADGRCWPSVEALCEASRLGRSTVIRALGSLEAAGYISRQRRRAKSTVYVLSRDRLSVPRVPERDHPDAGPSEIGTVPERDFERSQSGTVLKRTPNRTPNLSSRKRDAYTAEFERWWLIYPKRDGSKGSKFVASKAWVKALTAATVETLTAAVSLYANSQRVRDGFAKDAATWLNQRCWEEFSVADMPGEGVEDWLRGEWSAGRVLRIEERTGMRYPQPDIPIDLPQDDVERWLLQQCRNWISANHEAIIRRLTGKESA